MSEIAKRAEQRTVVARDGVEIAYSVVGQGERTLLLANGLGGRLYAWKPLIGRTWRDYRLITWDYRGLFASSSPASPVRLSVRDHAEDALQVLDAEGVDRAVWFGWSMGVQVALEAAAIQPERCAGLVLLNGTYGHVFSSGFQPGFRVPILPRYLHDVVEWLQRHPDVRTHLASLSRRTTLLSLGLFWLIWGRRAGELHPLLKRYTDEVYGSQGFGNYLRLFQELDAHSAYHQLPDISAPALVVSGRFDVMTPAYQSREIARRLPDAEHLHVRRASHFVLLERPEEVLPRIERFLRERARWS